MSKVLRVLVCCDPKREKCCRLEDATRAMKHLHQFLEAQIPPHISWSLSPSPCLGKCKEGPLAYIEGSNEWLKNISKKNLKKKKDKVLKKLRLPLMISPHEKEK